MSSRPTHDFPSSFGTIPSGPDGVHQDAVAAKLDFPNFSKGYGSWLERANNAIFLVRDALPVVHQEGNAHLDRYGAGVYGNRRAFLSIFRAYWSTGRLEEAKKLALDMASRLGPSSGIAPDACLIWKTLAADVTCRMHRHSSRKAAQVYGELAEEYARYDGASSKAYGYLHRALQAFYTGEERWEMALHYITSASESLDNLRRHPPPHATETFVERRLAILVTKATLLECLGNAAAAIRTYSDIMATCAEDHSSGPDVHVETWHQFADRRIMVLKLTQNHHVPRDQRLFPEHKGNKLSGSGAATLLSLPKPKGVSHDSTSVSARLQVIKDMKRSQGPNSIHSCSPGGKSTKSKKTIHLPPTGRRALKVSGPRANKGSSAPAGSPTDFPTKEANQVPQRRVPSHNNNSSNSSNSSTSSNMSWFNPYHQFNYNAAYTVGDMDMDMDLNQQRLQQAREAAKAMNRGDYSGLSLFDGQRFASGRPALLPHDPHSVANDDDDGWSPEEATVLASMAKCGMRIRSDTVFRMVWCYANGYGRKYVVDATDGEKKEAKGKGKEGAKQPLDDGINHCCSFEYFVRERSRVLGEAQGDLRCLNRFWNTDAVYNSNIIEYASRDVNLAGSLRQLHTNALHFLELQREDQLLAHQSSDRHVFPPAKWSIHGGPLPPKVARGIEQLKERFNEGYMPHWTMFGQCNPFFGDLCPFHEERGTYGVHYDFPMQSRPAFVGPIAKDDQSVDFMEIPYIQGVSPGSDSDSDVGLVIPKPQRKRCCASQGTASRLGKQGQCPYQYRDEKPIKDSAHPNCRCVRLPVNSVFIKFDEPDSQPTSLSSSPDPKKPQPQPPATAASSSGKPRSATTTTSSPRVMEPLDDRFSPTPPGMSTANRQTPQPQTQLQPATTTSSPHGMKPGDDLFIPLPQPPSTTNMANRQTPLPQPQSATTTSSPHIMKPRDNGTTPLPHSLPSTSAPRSATTTSSPHIMEPRDNGTKPLPHSSPTTSTAKQLTLQPQPRSATTTSSPHVMKPRDNGTKPLPHSSPTTSTANRQTPLPQPEPATTTSSPHVMEPRDDRFPPPPAKSRATRQNPPQPPPPRRQGSVSHSWEMVHTEQCQQEDNNSSDDADDESRELQLDGEKIAGGSQCSAM